MDIARTALALSAFQVSLYAVEHVDNFDDECPQCDQEGAVVVAQVYFTGADGRRELVDTCETCVWDVIKSAVRLSDDPITVEMETNALAIA